MWRYRRERVSLDKEWRRVQRELGYPEYERLAKLLRDGLPKGESAAGVTPRTKLGGSEVMFEILPSLDAGIYAKPDELEIEVVGRLTKMLDENRIKWHFPVGYFAGKGRDEDLYHDPGHLHFQGHALYADYLVERVTQDSARWKTFLAERRAGTTP